MEENNIVIPLKYKEGTFTLKDITVSDVGNRIIKNINFNDSCVNWLHREIDTVILNIDLCMWKQKGYQEEEPELKQKFLKFLNVKNYNWDSEKKEDEIDYDSIIEFTCIGNAIKIVLEDDDVSVLTFECTEVQMD